MLPRLAFVKFRVVYCRYDEGFRYNPREPPKVAGPLHHEAAGRLMARDAKAVRLHGADERIANVDGAPWIRSQLEFHGTVDHIGLDFYHLSEYVHAARRDLFDENDDDDGTA
jgi:hypothetical protein